MPPRQPALLEGEMLEPAPGMQPPLAVETPSGAGPLVPPRPARGGGAGIVGWLRFNLFGSVGNTALTLLVLGFLALILPPFIRWAVTDATIGGTARSACTGDGACWTFIRMRLPTFFYGHYPFSEWCDGRATGGAL